MYEFRIITKTWRSGTELNLDKTSGYGIEFTSEASPFVTVGGQTYQFLFWNTGWKTTNKRKVHWKFNATSQGTWTATRWYGPPGGSTGPPRVRADAFLINGNVVLSATPIDEAASTFLPGAHPFNGNYYEIGTAGGDVTVVAKDPYDNYDFAGWLQLVGSGNDGVCEVSETDSVGTIGDSGFNYDPVVIGPFPVDQGTSPDLVATYRLPLPPPLPVTDFGPIRELIYEVIFPELHKPEFLWPHDPSDFGPMDRVRLKLLGQLLSQTRPGPGTGTDFRRLVKAAPNMSQEELKRAMQSLKMTLKLGKTALGAIEAQLKAKNK